MRVKTDGVKLMSRYIYRYRDNVASTAAGLFNAEKTFNDPMRVSSFLPRASTPAVGGTGDRSGKICGVGRDRRVTNIGSRSFGLLCAFVHKVS